MIESLERAASAAYLPGGAVQTVDGHEVTLISHPYTDGDEIFVLARTDPNDLGSWLEYRINEIIVPALHETPAALADSISLTSTMDSVCLVNSPAKPH